MDTAFDKDGIFMDELTLKNHWISRKVSVILDEKDQIVSIQSTAKWFPIRKRLRLSDCKCYSRIYCNDVLDMWCFCIENEGSQYILEAETVEKKQEWVKRLKRLCNKISFEAEMDTMESLGHPTRE